MRQAVVNLVEAVRGLRLSRSSGTHGVRIGLPPNDLAPQLLATLEALEAVERDSGLSVEEELAKVKAGLEGVFRWIRLQGMSTDEPLEILARSMGDRGGRKPKAYTMMPAFVPGHARKKEWKPKLGIGGEFGASAPRTLEDHRKVGQVMDQVVASMGLATLPKPMPVEERSSPGMGPC